MDSGQPQRDAIWGRLYDLCSVLRGPDGCAWDRDQSPQSLAPYLIEEMHEVVEALALGDRDLLTEEVGDAFYLWVFFLLALEDAGIVSPAEAVDRLEAKLLRRHPHVFGAEQAEDSRSARGRWEIAKRRERPEGSEWIRALPAGMPALARARRIQEKAAAFGFDWADAADVLVKIREETEELATELEQDPQSPRASEELGDLLLAVVNLARHLRQDPEGCLIVATEKFRTRFNEMARSIERSGHQLGEASLDLMETHWQSVKSSPPSASPPSDLQ